MSSFETQQPKLTSVEDILELVNTENKEASQHKDARLCHIWLVELNNEQIEYNVKMKKKSKFV